MLFKKYLCLSIRVYSCLFNDQTSKFTDLSVYNLWISSMICFTYFTDIYVCSMFEFIFLELDFDTGRSYWVEYEMGRNWRIPESII